jgi:glycosyltransferase involved in cell wall biosynthesis
MVRKKVLMSQSSTTALFFAPAAYPLGGVQTWLDYVVPGLAAHGIKATVALCSGQHHDVAAYRAAHPLLPVEIVENPTGSRQGRVNAIAGLIERLRPTLAVSANIADTYLGVAKARRSSRDLVTRAVMSLHAIQSDFVNEICSSREIVDAVITTNRLSSRLVEETGYPRERVLYAPYGVSSSPLVKAHPRAGLALGSRTPVRIAYVGRFEESQKRISLLAQLCDLLVADQVSFELWLAGGGPDESALRLSLETHTAAGRVNWLGHVPATDVATRVYQEVDLLINPSYWETGPIVAWEAMAHGVVVISSRYVGSGQEGALVDGQNCRLFEIGDAAGAAMAIRSMCSQADRATIRANAAQLVLSRYTVDASVRSWADCLRQILELPERPTSAASVPASGRLDNFFGADAGERIRSGLGLKFSHAEPGSEWPHSYGQADDSSKFWGKCAELDRSSSHNAR